MSSQPDREPQPDPEEAFAGAAPAGEDDATGYASRDQRGGAHADTGAAHDVDGRPGTAPDREPIVDEDLLADADAAGPES